MRTTSTAAASAATAGCLRIRVRESTPQTTINTRYGVKNNSSRPDGGYALTKPASSVAPIAAGTITAAGDRCLAALMIPIPRAASATTFIGDSRLKGSLRAVATRSTSQARVPSSPAPRGGYANAQ